MNLEAAVDLYLRFSAEQRTRIECRVNTYDGECEKASNRLVELVTMLAEREKVNTEALVCPSA
jgi:hypothetical protein